MAYWQVDFHDPEGSLGLSAIQADGASNFTAEATVFRGFVGEVGDDLGYGYGATVRIRVMVVVMILSHGHGHGHGHSHGYNICSC